MGRRTSVTSVDFSKLNKCLGVGEVLCPWFVWTKRQGNKRATRELCVFWECFESEAEEQCALDGVGRINRPLGFDERGGVNSSLCQPVYRRLDEPNRRRQLIVAIVNSGWSRLSTWSPWCSGLSLPISYFHPIRLISTSCESFDRLW